MTAASTYDRADIWFLTVSPSRYGDYGSRPVPSTAIPPPTCGPRP
jgi:hypothetical protein